MFVKHKILRELWKKIKEGNVFGQIKAFMYPINSHITQCKKKKQKSNRAVASGNKSLFIAWIYIECSFLSIVAKSNSLQLNVDNYIETNQCIDIDYRYTLLAKF